MLRETECLIFVGTVWHRHCFGPKFGTGLVQNRVENLRGALMPEHQQILVELAKLASAKYNFLADFGPLIAAAIVLIGLI